MGGFSGFVATYWFYVRIRDMLPTSISLVFLLFPILSHFFKEKKLKPRNPGMCGSLTTATWLAISGLERLGFLSHTLRQRQDMAVLSTSRQPRGREMGRSLQWLCWLKVGESPALSPQVQGWGGWGNICLPQGVGGLRWQEGEGS